MSMQRIVKILITLGLLAMSVIFGLIAGCSNEQAKLDTEMQQV